MWRDQPTNLGHMAEAGSIITAGSMPSPNPGGCRAGRTEQDEPILAARQLLREKWRYDLAS